MRATWQLAGAGLLKGGIDNYSLRVKGKHFVKDRLHHTRHSCYHWSLCRVRVTVCASHTKRIMSRTLGLCSARALIAESEHEEVRAQLWPQLAATTDLG